MRNLARFGLSVMCLLAGCSTSKVGDDLGNREVADREVRAAERQALNGDLAAARPNLESALSTYLVLGFNYGVRGERSEIQAKYAEVLAAQGECARAGTELAEAVRTILTDNSIDITLNEEGRNERAKRYITGYYSLKNHKPCEPGSRDYRQVANEARLKYASQAALASAKAEEARAKNANNLEDARVAAERDRAETMSTVSGAVAAMVVQRGATAPLGMTTSTAAGIGATQYEQCRCGPDYIPCWVRNAQKAGTRYTVSSEHGWDNFTGYDSVNRLGVKKGWKKDTDQCSTVAQ